MPHQSSADTTQQASSKPQEAEASLRQQIEMLERENRLMASAYHSLAGRLQMSNVTLQRRDQQPLTWLKRQRKEAVDGQRMVVPNG